eukprot:COSAG04_NODE_2453_length_4093_cov_4.621933_5_plen_204_part_00
MRTLLRESLPIESPRLASQAIKQAGADAWAACPARRMVKWAAAAGQPAYRYLFSHVPDGRHNGAPYNEASHGCDNHMLFHQDLEGETDVAVSERMGEWRQQSLRSRPHEADRRTVHPAVDFFARMADAGAPGTGCEPSVVGCTWPAYAAPRFSTLIFGTVEAAGESSGAFVAEGVREEKCAFWDGQFDKMVQHGPTPAANGAG